jgi:hypothetical protein
MQREFIQLNADMTPPRHIIEVFEGLRFTPNSDQTVRSAVIEIDQAVRDYLVRALTR